MPNSLKPNARSRGEIFTWHLFVLFLASAITLFSRFFHHDAFGFFEDDFFYYAVAARNFALHGVSTFDGTHLTNGYHPLWFLILAALLRVSSGTAFLVVVQVVSLAAMVGFYLGMQRLLRGAAIDPSLLNPLALLLSLHALLLLRYGMEVTVSLPLGVATLAWIMRPSFQWTGTQTFTYGLLACLTVLGRLDSILLFAPLIVFQTIAADVPWDLRLRRFAIFSAGFFPLLVYLAVNLHTFGTLLPVSASAKQMKPLFPPSLAPLAGLFLPFDRMKAAVVYPAVALLLIGLVRFVQTRKRLPPPLLPVIAALLLFPFLQNGLLCLLSDWGIWPWYYYPLVYSSIGAFLVLLHPSGYSADETSGTVRWSLALPTAFYLIFVSVYAVERKPSSISLIGADLALWMRQHPGIYAMGDEAGVTAYLSGQPIVQVEGLMMDREYLTHIRRKDPFESVLKNYGVRYYTVLYAKQVDGCYHVGEPSNAGPMSPHMLGKICAAPLFTSSHAGSTASVFDAADVR